MVIHLERPGRPSRPSQQESDQSPQVKQPAESDARTFQDSTESYPPSTPEAVYQIPQQPTGNSYPYFGHTQPSYPHRETLAPHFSPQGPERTGWWTKPRRLVAVGGAVLAVGLATALGAGVALGDKRAQEQQAEDFDSRDIVVGEPSPPPQELPVSPDVDTDQTELLLEQGEVLKDYTVEDLLWMGTESDESLKKRNDLREKLGLYSAGSSSTDIPSLTQAEVLELVNKQLVVIDALRKNGDLEGAKLALAAVTLPDSIEGEFDSPDARRLGHESEIRTAKNFIDNIVEVPEKALKDPDQSPFLLESDGDDSSPVVSEMGAATLSVRTANTKLDRFGSLTVIIRDIGDKRFVTFVGNSEAENRLSPGV